MNLLLPFIALSLIAGAICNDEIAAITAKKKLDDDAFHNVVQPTPTTSH